MPDRLTCPICRDGLMAELVRSAIDLDQAEPELFACLTCCFRAPLHVVHFIAAERAELARLKGVGVKFTEASQLRMLNAEMRDLAEDLRELANSAGTAAALADDTFDVLARDGYRGRALAYRAAAQRLEQLTGLEPPKAVGHG